MARRLRVFLSCSSEVKEAASYFCQQLVNHHNVFPWWEAGEFGSLATTFDALVRASESYDAAVFILSEDDLVRSRGQVQRAFRDNVLFEFGLFLGTLKASNLYAVIVQQPKQPGGQGGPDLGEVKPAESLKIPSDLAGVHIARVEAPDRDTLEARMNATVREGAAKFAKLLPHRKMPALVTGWSHNVDTNEFTLTLSGWELKENAHRARDFKLLMVAIRDNPRVGLERNEQILVNTPTDWPTLPGDKLVLGVHAKDLAGLQKGDRVHLVLLLCPPTLDPKQFNHLLQFQKLSR